MVDQLYTFERDINAGVVGTNEEALLARMTMQNEITDCNYCLEPGHIG
jgi:hypothetical protein